MMVLGTCTLKEDFYCDCGSCNKFEKKLEAVKKIQCNNCKWWYE